MTVKSWIKFSRCIDAYIESVGILDFAFNKSSPRAEIVYLYKRCNNLLWQPCEVVLEHVIQCGFTKNFTT